MISGNLATGVAVSSGLAATVRTSNDGYRVFYHDNNGTSRTIQYSYFASITWGTGTPVINDKSETITTITTDGGNNLTAYGIDNKTGNILPSTLQSNGTWLQRTTPPHHLTQPLTKLPVPPIPTQNFTSFNPTNITLSSTTSPTNPRSKTLFYIGTDHSLHQVNTFNNWQTWTLAPSQNTDIWPLADQSNAPFTLTNNSAGTTLSIFYVSGGMLVQVVSAGGVWQGAVRVFPVAYISSSALISTNSTIPADPLQTASAKGRSHGTVLGLGMGVGLGLPVVGVLWALLYLFWRRRRALKDKVVGLGENELRPPVPEKDPQEVSGVPVRPELADDLDTTQYELAVTTQFELADDVETTQYELPGYRYTGRGRGGGQMETWI